MTIFELNGNVHVAPAMPQLSVSELLDEIGHQFARDALSQRAGLCQNGVEVDALQQGCRLCKTVSCL